ncbi:MAG: hypothetical protein CBB87_01560 [Micavibrio sp. TMED27]|nr:hypothetical protein [Micavibrio sp.]OUT92452.1 MAG: hypothetical protein CBB87_01560 [Micavibrio sp. TMED27]|tara:strand:+ start:434 stop:1144 length:711 start_codon:yes stop_codon:yes gene_type:complete
MRNERSFERADAREIDQGLRQHMNEIYTKMTAGVLVTAITAYIVGNSEFLLNLFLGGPQAYIVMFAPLAIVWFGFNPATMPAKTLRISFFALAVLYGISFSAIAAMATQDPTYSVAVAKAFFIATSMFAGLSIIGYTTKVDLSPMRTFLSMGIIGLVAISVMNIFFGSEAIGNAVAGIGIVLFAGVTVWQTQNMKEMYSPHLNKEIAERIGWDAALSLYISFIAMFQYVLHFMQER